MEINKFYKFGSRLSSTTFQASPKGLNKYRENNRRLDEWNLILGNFEKIDFPVIFKQDYGKKLLDILDTGWSSLYLISDNLKSILEENKITGWKCYNVEVLDKKRGKIEGYHGFSVTGRCGAIDYNKSEIIEKRLVPTGPLCKYYKGLYVGLDKWDGCDFFMPENYYGMIVTEKVAKLLKKQKVTNLDLKNLADIEISDFTVKTAMEKQNKHSE